MKVLRTLKDGEIGPDVIETDTSYYVVKLDKVNDEEATETKKQSIISTRENKLYTDTTEKWLDDANITANKNTIPNDPQSPFVTSGIRLGTAAVSSRGMNPDDMDQIAEAIAMLIDDHEANTEKAKAIVKELTDKYPLY